MNIFSFQLPLLAAEVSKHLVKQRQWCWNYLRTYVRDFIIDVVSTSYSIKFLN